MMLLHSTSKKTAALLSYICLGLNSVSSILLTPFLLQCLGVDEYGLYQMVYSIGHYILILDLGISTVMVRYISEYRAREDFEGMKRFAGMMAVLTMIISAIIMLAGLFINSNIENIFTNLSDIDYSKSHWMFVLMVYQIILTVVDHYFHGVIFAHERFVFAKIISLAKILIVFTLTIVFVLLGFGAVGVVMANSVVVTFLTICDAFYTFNILKFRIKFVSWNNALMMPVFGLMLAMLLQSVVGHVNSSVDKTILGIMCTPTDVTVYSIAATIITLFNTVPTVISGLFQPEVTRMVVKGTNGEQLTNLVIKVGRWQFLLCGAILAGLTLFGMDFLTLWVGNQLSLDSLHFSWIIMLIILPFNMVPLVQTVCISIMNAYDKRLYRSLILAAMCVLNILFTIIVISYLGPIGSPLGTALSYFVGYVVILNIYYSKVLKLQIVRMFRQIFRKTLVCLVAASLISLPLLQWHASNWGVFFLKICIFCFFFAVCMYFWGFSVEEKKIVDSYLKRKIVR